MFAAWTTDSRTVAVGWDAKPVHHRHRALAATILPPAPARVSAAERPGEPMRVLRARACTFRVHELARACFVFCVLC